MPKDNEKDLAEIPQIIQDQLSINFVETMDEVLKIALDGTISVREEKEEKLEEFTAMTKDFSQESITH